MAKDPAFLFYSSDFLTGTLTMTDEQVGKYIKLLCLQHQKEFLTEKDMLFICKSYDEDIFIKFTKNDQGLYFNERLMNESLRRKEYSKSRSDNRKSNKIPTYNDEHIKNICLTCVNHMENETETINIICNNCFNKKNYKKSKIENLEFEELKYCSSEFLEIWNILIKEPKWKKKSRNALEMALKKLNQFDEQTAIQMMQNTISGGYQGLFEIKNSVNNTKHELTKTEQIIQAGILGTQMALDNLKRQEETNASTY